MFFFYFYVRPRKVGPEVFYSWQCRNRAAKNFSCGEHHINGKVYTSKAENAEENSETTTFGGKHFV